MITEEKIKEIKKQLGKGIPEGEIKNDLARQGYSEDDIKKAFEPHKYDMRSWILISAIILLLIGLYELIAHSSLLILILSGLLFYSYYLEKQRKQKEKQRGENNGNTE